MSSFLDGIKNVLLWSYERGSWQYDVLCLLIVGTIFLVPSHFFGDRDRDLRGRSGQAKIQGDLASNAVLAVREIDSSELQAFLQKENKMELINSPHDAVVAFLKARHKREVKLSKLETYSDEQGRIVYRAWYE